MSQKSILQSIFGDQTNIKRCVQPPGGNSSIVFGEGVKSDVVKGKNHQASDIFNLDENKEVTRKRPHHQQEDTQNRVFGGGNAKTAKGDDELKGADFNPITGDNAVLTVPQKIVAKEKEEEEEEHEKKKDAEAVNTAVSSITSTVTTTTTTPCTTTSAPAVLPSRGRQPPGGRSTNLW